MEKVFVGTTVMLTVVLAALAIKFDKLSQQVNNQPQSHALENVEIVSIGINGSNCEYYMATRNKQLVTIIHKGSCTNCQPKTFTVDSSWEALQPSLHLKSK